MDAQRKREQISVRESHVSLWVTENARDWMAALNFSRPHFGSERATLRQDKIIDARVHRLKNNRRTRVKPKGIRLLSAPLEEASLVRVATHGNEDSKSDVGGRGRWKGEKSGDLLSGKDSVKYAPRHASRTRSGVRTSGRSMEKRRDRSERLERSERRRRGIFAIPIPSSTSSLSRNLHLHPSLSPPSTLPRDVDVSRVTSPTAECSTAADAKARRFAAIAIHHCPPARHIASFSQIFPRAAQIKESRARLF